MVEPNISPKRRIKATVQYDGTDFLGFQRQAKGRTVQGVLEQALGELLGHPVAVKAAGRTDAGVHARGQVISFVTESSIPAANIPVAVTSFLPPDVIISSADDVDEGFDPQKDAVSKTYCYRIWRERRPTSLGQVHPLVAGAAGFGTHAGRGFLAGWTA